MRTETHDNLTAAVSPVKRLRAFHRNEHGTISIISVFALLMFTILLVMITNVGRAVDDKIRMQNAADTAAFTGGVAIARGMNSLSFSNHLLAEVFALTAYMREARDRYVESFMPDVLEMWGKIAPVFVQAAKTAADQTNDGEFISRFGKLGEAIPGKLPLEQGLANTFGDMESAHSAILLPMLEAILQGQYIPEYQRAIVMMTPSAAFFSADEIAMKHGAATQQQHGGEPICALLWRTDVQAMGFGADESNWRVRTMPVVDPSPYGMDPDASTYDPNYITLARQERKLLANMYLRNLNHGESTKTKRDWISHWMANYFSYPTYNYDENDHGLPGQRSGKMGQLISLWRMSSYYRLLQLFDEYPDTNLPFQIRWRASSAEESPPEIDHNFVAVAYWTHRQEMFPGLFRNPVNVQGGSDPFAFSQVTVFALRRRLQFPFFEPVPDPQDPTKINWRFYWEQPEWPQTWNLTNQNWSAKIVPTSSDSIASIVQQKPPPSSLSWFRPPNLGSSSQNVVQMLRVLNTH